MFLPPLAAKSCQKLPKFQNESESGWDAAPGILDESYDAQAAGRIKWVQEAAAHDTVEDVESEVWALTHLMTPPNLPTDTSACLLAPGGEALVAFEVCLLMR